MKIKKVHYLATLNLGNYSNEKIGFSAEIENGETPEQVLEQLREKVKGCALPNSEKLYSEIRDRKYALDALNEKIEKAKNQWNATAEFLRTQGIKPDAVDLPQFTHLLPQVESEHSEVSDGEVEDDDDDDDDGF